MLVRGAFVLCATILAGCGASGTSGGNEPKVLAWRETNELRGPMGKHRPRLDTESFLIVRLQIPAKLATWRTDAAGATCEIALSDFKLHRSGTDNVLTAQGFQDADDNWVLASAGSDVKQTRSFSQQPDSLIETVVFVHNITMTGASRRSVKFRDSDRVELTPQTEDPGM